MKNLQFLPILMRSAPMVVALTAVCATTASAETPVLAGNGADWSEMQGARGRVTCRILENGKPASGTIVLRKNGAEITSGPCTHPVTAPVGEYDAVLKLDGALDRPEQKRQVSVVPGGGLDVSADFPTGILEVQIAADGRRAAGMATLFAGGRRIGTLGGGVSAHVSAGTYDVVVSYRGREQRFDGVRIETGDRRVVNATF